MWLYIVSRTITITGVGDDDETKQLDERNKEAIFKNCAPFTDCISEVKNTPIENAKYMPVYNLSEYSDNCLKTSGSLWKKYRDDPNENTTHSESFN